MDSQSVEERRGRNGDTEDEGLGRPEGGSRDCERFKPQWKSSRELQRVNSARVLSPEAQGPSPVSEC